MLHDATYVRLPIKRILNFETQSKFSLLSHFSLIERTVTLSRCPRPFSRRSPSATADHSLLPTLALHLNCFRGKYVKPFLRCFHRSIAVLEDWMHFLRFKMCILVAFDVEREYASTLRENRRGVNTRQDHQCSKMGYVCLILLSFLVLSRSFGL